MEEYVSETAIFRQYGRKTACLGAIIHPQRRRRDELSHCVYLYTLL